MASNDEILSLLKSFGGKLDDLSQEVQQLKKSGGKERKHPAFIESPDPEGTPGKKGGVVFNSPQPEEPVKPKAPDTTPKSRARGVKISESPADTPPLSPAATHSLKPVDPQLQKKQTTAAKLKRKEHFDNLIFKGEWSEIPQLPNIKCVWLHCVSLALKYASDEPQVSVEKILSTNKMALHYVTFPSVTLAELYDTLAEYISSAPELKSKNMHVEVATFDSTPLEDAGDESRTGDRLPVTSLTAFRKELHDGMGIENSIYIFNYDPFIVQENEIKESYDDEEEEEEGGGSPRPVKAKQWAKKNMGAFSLLINFNPALHTVTLATPHLQSNGKFLLETHQCSLNTLYLACCAKDGYSKLSRGFVRVTKDEHAEPVPQIFPTSMLDGTDSKGMLSIALDVAIAPHILALGIMHNVVAATMLSESQQHASLEEDPRLNLRGIPVTDLCVVLQLPVHVIVGGSNQTSLQQAYSWYSKYLTAKSLEKEIKVGVVTVTRKDNADDGAPSLADNDFFSHIIDVIKTKGVMLCNFNINTARNVVVDPTADPSHFALIVGIDEHRGIVRLADVSVKKFRKTWHIPLVRLYNAVIGYGYMIVSKDMALCDRFGAAKRGEKILATARYALPPSIPAEYRSFEFPQKTYNVTILALVLNRLGFNTTVEDIVYHSGFHISFLLSEHLPLTDVQRIVTFYIHHRLKDQITCETTVFEGNAVDLQHFKSELTSAQKDANRIVVVNFNPLAIQQHTSVWNGSNGGPYALISAYNSNTGEATLTDANPGAYYRTWNCPVEVLFNACKDVDRISGRSRGWLIFTKEKSTLYSDSSLIDMRYAMCHHPFKVTISPPAACIALAAATLLKAPISLEDVIYAAPDFRLLSLTQQADFTAVCDLAKHFLAKYPKLQLEPRADTDTQFEKNIVVGASKVSIIVYEVAKMFPDSGHKNLGACIVNRFVGGKLLVADGNPTRFGGQWSASVGDVKAASLGILQICLK